MKSFVGVAVSSLVGALLGVLLYMKFAPPKQIIIQEPNRSYQTASNLDLFSGEQQREFLASTPNDFTSAALVAMPSVVFIKAVQQSDNRYGYPSRSTGSGVIVSEDGYIVTNNHVVERSSDIEVIFHDNRQYTARIIGTDKTTDLALIKVDVDDLPYLMFGNSDSLRIGEWVMAVGNPFGLQSTVTAGIVSAKGRDINIISGDYKIEAFIQTDAAVNPGNSGGALVNTNGELIGINTAIMTYSGRYEGYSFAIPGNLAQKIIDDLKDFGGVQRGLLGVRIRNIDGALARDKNKENVNDLTASLGLENTEGVFIDGVNDKSGAQEAGIKAYDVIISVNGVKTASISELQEQIGRLRPGDLVEVEYIRKGSVRKARVELKRLNQPEYIAEKYDYDILDDLGIEVRELRTEERLKLGKRGLRVTKVKPGSKVDQSNLVESYIITHVNGESVTDLESLRSSLEKSNDVIEIDGFYEDIDDEYGYKIQKK